MATEQELSVIRHRLLGQIDEHRIRRVTVPRTDSQVIERFVALTDLCSTISDILDELGVGGAIPAHVLAPVGTGCRVVGTAVTIRYARQSGSVGAHLARSAKPLLADRDLYGVGEPGDVAVFDCGGDRDCSVLGGLSLRWAKRLGVAGCVVDGGVRDLASMHAANFPVWSAGRTPITGRHRLEAVEINGSAALSGIQVNPGDLIAADDDGVCVVPFDHVSEVIGRCEEAERAEREVVALLDQEDPPAKTPELSP